MDISGKWKLGFEKDQCSQEIIFPTVLQNEGIGIKNQNPETIRWAREYIFEGKAFIEKEIYIDEGQVTKITKLILERCHWGIQLFVNDVYIDYRENISVPQIFDLTGKFHIGKNKITLSIDNSMIYPLKKCSHHFTDDTQGNWNGIIGEMKLKFYDQVYIDDIKISTCIEHKCAKIYMKVINAEFEKYKNRYEKIHCTLSTGDVYEFNAYLPSYENEVSFILELPEIRLWSHFEPNLYSVKIECLNQSEELTFGFRKIETRGKFIYVNGDRVILRGSSDGCVFPEKGTPPMDIDSWIQVFQQYKRMGLNHFRAHSWCPPNAAFEAADMLGIYMQVEGPASGTLGQGQLVEGENDPLKQSIRTQNYIKNELLGMQNFYGNHPSFVMLSIGNELYTDYSVLDTIVDALKENDTRQLISSGTNNNWIKPHIGRNDDFFVGFMIDTWHGLLRGSYHTPDVGHINNKQPCTTTNYQDATNAVDIPIITHELGQYLAYPDYSEIEKYKGKMKPYHLKYFKSLMEKNGMEGMDQIFHVASGQSQQRLYKEDIEAVLRTENISGFQLLDIKDFPGQCVALCGVLDVFGDEKKYFDLDMWKNCCNDIVPLLLLDKRVFKNTEKVRAKIKISNYSREDVIESVIINDEVVSEKALALKGRLNDLGEFELDFSKFNLGKSKITVKFGKYQNSWEIWVYEDTRLETCEDVLVTSTWNLELERYLENGGSAVYISNGENIKHCIKGAFQNNFWTYRMFKNHDPAGTVGMYIDSKHPIFKNFATDSHNNWQWFYMARYGTPLDLSYLSTKINPIVQPIDTYERNLKLALFFEVNVGKGRLLISTFNFNQYMENIEVKTLYNAILKYMKSRDYVKAIDVKARSLDCIFKIVSDGRLEK